jgi:vacuolar-type H+-ATPase subunit C/Vma6
MKPARYSTIMPRIALESLKLIDKDELICLVGKNLEEIFSFLVNTTYSEEIVSLCGDVVEPGLLEDALFQNFAKTFDILLKNSSGYINNLLISVLHKFDAMNLKTMFRMVKAGINVEDILQHIIPLGTYDRIKCQAILLKANTISAILGSLQEQDFGFFLKQKFNFQIRFGDLTPLETALDKAVFKGILDEIKNLNRKDKKIATNILGIESDTLNVKIILKFKALMTNLDNIKENLMPVALIDESILESAIKEADIKSTLQRLSISVKTKHQVYRNVFAKLVKESDSPLSRLEFILEKAPLEMSFFELKENMRYYNIGYILSFLNMKWAEIKNLRCVINAMARNVDTDKTLDLLFLPENY